MSWLFAALFVFSANYVGGIVRQENMEFRILTSLSRLVGQTMAKTN